MIAISLFLAGLPRIGAPQAALLSTVEPVVTLALAVTLLGDRLRPGQLLGAAAVLLAVVIVHLQPEAREAPD
jgi:drug/metabolite transporter (DMT)-like permease